MDKRILYNLGVNPGLPLLMERYVSG
jgi:hypothetical protein